MINLLPPEVKETYHFARINTSLLNWVGIFVITLVGLAGLTVGGSLYLKVIAKNYDKQVQATELSLRQQDQAGTQKQVTDISNNLKLAVQVLSKEVLFSKLLKQLGTAIPSNTRLSGLTINQLQGALDITASTADYNAATQLQVNLADSNNKIFTKADIISINCAGATSSTPTAPNTYPCTVTVRALFAKDNPFLFINNSKVAP